MSDFTYRGCKIVDTCPVGANYRRVDGSQRWQVHLPSGGLAYAFTKREVRDIVCAAVPWWW